MSPGRVVAAIAVLALVLGPASHALALDPAPVAAASPGSSLLTSVDGFGNETDGTTTDGADALTSASVLATTLRDEVDTVETAMETVGDEVTTVADGVETAIDPVETVAETLENTTRNGTDGVRTSVNETLEGTGNLSVNATVTVGVGAGDTTTASPTTDTAGSATGTTTTASDGSAAGGGTTAGENATGGPAGPESGDPSGLPGVPGGAGGVAVGLGTVAAGAAAARALGGSASTAGTAPGAVRAGNVWLRTAVGRRLADAGLADWVGRVLAALGYSRYDDTDPLDHQTRRALFDHVRSEPGTYLTAASEATDVSISTARYHLRVLEHENLVEDVSIHGKRRFLPADADATDGALGPALADDATASLLDALAGRGPASVSELADAVDRDPSTVTHHLQRLEDDGLVVREREGRSVTNRLAADVRDVLAPGRASAADD